MSTELVITADNNTVPFPSITFNLPIGLGQDWEEIDSSTEEDQAYALLRHEYPLMTSPEDIVDVISEYFCEIFEDKYEIDWFDWYELQLLDFDLGFTQEHIDGIYKVLKKFKRETPVMMDIV
jgi:hypothetical protein